MVNGLKIDKSIENDIIATGFIVSYIIKDSRIKNINNETLLVNSVITSDRFIKAGTRLIELGNKIKEFNSK